MRTVKEEREAKLMELYLSFDHLFVPLGRRSRLAIQKMIDDFVLLVHLRLTAAIKTLLSRRYLELLTGKLVALLLDFSFELIKID
jgi:hypothetical protein